MKRPKRNCNKLLFTLLSLIIFFNVAAAQKLDQASVQKLINSKNFVFKAETVLPLSGGARQLTPDYDMRFLGDSIISYLPYFGRAYVADINGEGGIHFTSTEFAYKITGRKKGGWDIDIKLKDTRDVRQLHFIISEEGYATLQVISENRQAISYNGYIVPVKP